MSKDPFELRYYGDPVLRRKADPVLAVTPEVRAIIRGMFECMYRERGVGLAAPQVGVSRRIFVVDVEGEEGVRSKFAIVNPVMKQKDGSIIGEEGCLSIPGIHADVKRHKEVVFEGLDEDGKPIVVRGEGLLARALQHELDHLDGILFIDRLSAIRRKLLEAKLARMHFGEEDRSVSSTEASPPL